MKLGYPALFLNEDELLFDSRASSDMAVVLSASQTLPRKPGHFHSSHLCGPNLSKALVRAVKAQCRTHMLETA